VLCWSVRNLGLNGRIPQELLSVQVGDTRDGGVSPCSFSMDNITDTCLTLEDRLEVIWNLTGEQLEREIRHQSLLDLLPTTFLATLDDETRAICFRAPLICYSVTWGTQAPQVMRLRAVLADQTKQDSLVAAGTGSGKTSRWRSLRVLAITKSHACRRQTHKTRRLCRDQRTWIRWLSKWIACRSQWPGGW